MSVPGPAELSRPLHQIQQGYLLTSLEPGADRAISQALDYTQSTPRLMEWDRGYDGFLFVRETFPVTESRSVLVDASDQVVMAAAPNLLEMVPIPVPPCCPPLQAAVSAPEGRQHA